MFFGNKRQEHIGPLQTDLENIESRLYVFLAKLDERADMLLQGFIAEAPAVMADDNIHGQAYYRFRSATSGQLATLRQKVQEVRESQINGTWYKYDGSFDFGGAASNLLYDWRQRCFEKLNSWEETLYKKEQQAIDQVEAKDYEVIFHELIRQYEGEKENVHCKQCGAKLVIEGMYYYSVYIPCQFCHTQNIFDPGTNARKLEETARKLAEQRNKAILEQQEAMQTGERELYQQMHELHLSLIHEKDSKVVQEKQKTIAALEIQRKHALEEAPLLLEQYYKAVFETMSELLPDLREHNERFFQAMQTSYLQHKMKH